MKEYTLSDYGKMERTVEKIINANMAIKSNHGFIYEIREIVSGDSDTFEDNGKTFSVELQNHSFDIGYILESNEELGFKIDRIAFNIINEINRQVSVLIENSQINNRLESFKKFIKIVINNIVTISIHDQRVHIRFGVAIVNE